LPTETDMADANLIPAHRRDARLRSARLRQWSTACIVYAGVLGVGYGMCRGFWIEAGDTSRDLEEVAQQIDQSNQAIDVLSQELAAARLMLDSTLKVADQPDWSVLLALTARTLGDQIVLERCQVLESTKDDSFTPSARRGRSRGRIALRHEMPDAFTMELSGYGRSPEAVARFVLRLERTALFDKVTIRSTDRQPFRAGEAIAFEIGCTLDGEGNSDR